MQTCPHCSSEIRVKELRYQGLFKSFRICPNCEGAFTVDTDTKYRQAAFIGIAMISLVFSIFLYYGDSKWLIPAFVSYVVLGLLIYWGNKKVFFVPYQKEKSSNKILAYGALAFGSLMTITGAVFVVIYVIEAIVARAGEPDQSLIFWYLPVLFLGLIGMVIGIGVGVWGFIRSRKIRYQIPQNHAQQNIVVDSRGTTER